MAKTSWWSGVVVPAVALVVVGCEELPSDFAPTDESVAAPDSAVAIDAIEPRPGDDDASDFDAGTGDAAEGRAHEDASGDAEPPRELDAAAVESPDAGPAGDADAASVAPSSFDAMYAVIVESCAGCHKAGRALDLSTPALAHSGMVNVAAMGYAACSSDGGAAYVRVVPGAPESSLLIQKLEGKQPCGNPMPPKALLSEDRIEPFRAWVRAGAPAPTAH